MNWQQVSTHRSWVFDCDGVLLDSNSLKTTAFFDAARPYGKHEAEQLVRYHTSNGGVSRVVKVDYFFREILRREPAQGERERLLEIFAQKVRAGLLTCALCDGALELLQALNDLSRGKCFVLTGGDQGETRTAFAARGMTKLFRAILGGPTPKMELGLRACREGVFESPALFFGDSPYDATVAAGCDMEFCFVSKYSEAPEFAKELSASQHLVRSLRDVIPPRLSYTSLA